MQVNHRVITIMNMRKLDNILWRILAMTGLNFLNYKLGFKEKCFRMFYMVGYVLSLSYALLTTLCFIRKERYKESIAAFLLPLYSGLLRYFS